ncbi:MAG: polyprenyl diphosphate synthase [Pseudomonadota bacterium]
MLKATPLAAAVLEEMGADAAVETAAAEAVAVPPRAGLRHVAIIMDGNGRWAQRRGLPRLAGHRRGADAVREIVEAAPTLGVDHLTLYAFSTENWKRSVEEVQGLMNLFRLYIRKEGRELRRRGARVRFIGDRTRLAEDLQTQMAALETATAENDKLHLTVAINYGGRDEIVDAARRLAAAAREGRLDPAALDAGAFEAELHTSGLPDPDLVIRTSGEMRVSNFLPWQTAYAEFAFVDECWPDFSAARFAEVLETAGLRERRFGAAE